MDNSGYSVAARAYIAALSDAGFSVTWESISGHNPKKDVVPENLREFYYKNIDYDYVLIHAMPSHFPRFVNSERQVGKKIIGYTVWEHDFLPETWVKEINLLDAVIVPCSWNKECFINSGISVPVFVVPHLSQFYGDKGYEELIKNKDASGLSSLEASVCSKALVPYKTNGAVIFYHIGFWSERKSPSAVVKAYLNEFKSGDNVLLVIKTSKKDLTWRGRSWRNFYRKKSLNTKVSFQRILRSYDDPARILFIDREDLSNKDLLAIHLYSDCFVSLARTEGWGMGAFDATLISNSVIMPGYGGQMDFLDSKRSLIVNYRLVPVNEPVWSDNYDDRHQWAEPDIKHAQLLMRSYLENKNHYDNKAIELSIINKKKFSVSSVVDGFRKAFAACS